METPAEVLVHNDLLGIKGTKGRLLGVSASGYYEVNLQFGDRRHRTLLPVARTVIIASDAEEGATDLISDIER
ncbi:MAG TPA: hypothetical protein VI942_12380 [Thermoanaerobaculia bacterium]|nr:hypothetical protein [Thermoanaerobaculia bacterium]